MDQVCRAVTALWEAGRTGVPCAPIRAIIGETDIETAYAVQEQITERRISEGARLVGRKIGLTARSVQAQLGVSQPDYGMLFHDMDVPIGGEIPLDRVVQPKVEAEIAFIMGRDLTSEKLTTADVLGAIEWAVPALEIVDSRIEGWNIRITTPSPTMPPRACSCSAMRSGGWTRSTCRAAVWRSSAMANWFRPEPVPPAWSRLSTRRSGWPGSWPRRDGRSRRAMSC
jgi:2-keto-4-pentenoate hydratase